MNAFPLTNPWGALLMLGALFCGRQFRRPQMLKTANISPTGARHERRAPSTIERKR
nr:MAG TPA_asm: hypothetical protein [Caudoviricetes sp.]